jgi:DNA primase
LDDLKLLKKRIYEEEKIEEVLEALDCKYVRREGSMYVAALPDGDNRRSVQIRDNEKLTSYIRSKQVSGDIFSIVSYIKHGHTNKSDIDNDVHQAKMWLINLFGYHDILDNSKRKDHNWNGWLKDLNKKRKKSADVVKEVKPNKPIPESTKNDYLMIPYIPWIKEGIKASTQMEFEVGFDWESKRVITLIRNINGELIGVKGRALDDENPYKYLYVEPMNKSIELFGLHKTLPYILEKKEIIIFEGYKSVMKSWQYGYKNCASIEGDDISPYQIALIKSLGIDIKIILCFDKDKSEEDVVNQAMRFNNRKVFYVLDERYLGEKDSPVDKGVKIWEKLLDKKVLYTP